MTGRKESKQALGAVRRCPMCEGNGGWQTAVDDSAQCDRCDGVTGWQILDGDEWVGLLDHLAALGERFELRTEPSLCTCKDGLPSSIGGKCVKCGLPYRQPSLPTCEHCGAPGAEPHDMGDHMANLCRDDQACHARFDARPESGLPS